MGIEEILEEKPPVEQDWKAEAEKAKAEADKAKAEAEEAKRVAQTYKEEIEVKGLRQKRTEELRPQAEPSDVQQKILDDYLSKRKDITDKYHDDLMKLPQEDFDMVLPVIDQIYHKNVAKNDYVATGEIERTLSRLIGKAKEQEQINKEKEQARLQGNLDAQQLQSAEISGVKSARQVSNQKITEEDKARAEETGRTPEREAEIRLAQEARRKEYSPGY